MFDKNAEIVEVPNDNTIAISGFSFTKLEEINTMAGRLIDFAGVLTRVGEVTEFRTKNDEVKHKRNLTLADDSGFSIDCSFWDQDALCFNMPPEENPVIALKGVRFTEMQGKSLTMTKFSCFYVNPPHPRTKELTEWWANFDRATLKSVNRDQAKAYTETRLDHGRLLSEMNDIFMSNPKALHQISSGTGQYFTVSGYITYIKNDDRVYYLACPDDNCRRKVVENDGMEDSEAKYRCDTCNKTYKDCVPSYMLLAKIADFSDSVYVNFYRQQADTIMNDVPAEKIKAFRDAGD